MQNFTAWLFSSPTGQDSPGAIFVWWEQRRVSFNLIIGTYGIVCLLVFFVAITTSNHLPPGDDTVEPLALMAAPLIINLLYTLGWIAEMTCRSIEPRVSPQFGPRLLKLGLGLGLFLSTLPAAYWVGLRLLQWIGIAI